MSLKTYREKRDFKVTPEPSGAVRAKASKGKKNLGYFIQEHHASHLHYDFRLELDGTLKSWAVPKGPSLDPADKRLAVQVEDHPLEYGSFEGSIPARQYGAGEVLLWDRGNWIPEGDPDDAYRRGRLKFELDGEKLSGKWTLVRMAQRSAKKEAKENWLLIKERDEAARTGKEAEIVTLRPESVLDKSKSGSKSGVIKSAGIKAATRKVAKQADSEAPGVSSGKASALASKAKPGTSKPRKSGNPEPGDALVAIPADVFQGAIKSKMPEQISPQLATLAEHAPHEGNWLAEIKFDGYRALLRIEKGRTQIFTRAGNDWTAKWPVLADAASGFPIGQAWLDGEVVAIAEDGSISFQLLQNSLKSSWHKGGRGRNGAASESAKSGPARLAYFVFDLLYLDGHDLRQLPLAQRKQLLKVLIEALPKDSPIRYSDHIDSSPGDAFSHACMHGLEGIVVKQADAPYQTGRSRSWLKVKCEHRQEFVIGGYTDPAGSREKFGALLLGVYDKNRQLRYAGRVGTGFNSDTLREISAAYSKLGVDAPAFVNPPEGFEARGVHWLKPALVAEVKFAEWTGDGLVRHASFQGLRADKKPADIIRENPMPETELHEVEVQASKEAATKPKTSKSSAAKSGKAALKLAATPSKLAATSKPPDTSAKVAKSKADSNQTVSVAGVNLSHPSRVLFADIGFTKFDLANFYADIKDWILPHLANRPLTLVRCPNGGDKPCFFQRNATDAIDEKIERITIPSDSGDAQYMMGNTLPALVSMVQIGVLELHTWGAHAPLLDKPDRMIFDLDPAPGLPWTNVIEAAQLLRSLLDDIGLRSFVKTTGGKGLHVVVPIKPEHGWDAVKNFSRGLAEHVAQVLPDRFTASMSKAKRGGKIFIDYLRNAAEATAVAAFSTRSRPGAPVSVPLAWEELSLDLHSDSYTVLNVRERLAGLKQDPWAEYFTLKQRLTAKMLGTFGPPKKA
ncbi:DNA ligase D [soil metagenome]